MIPGLEYESASFDNGNGSSSSAPDHHHQQQQQYPSSNDYGGASSSPASSVNSYSSINLDTPSHSSATTPSGHPSPSGYPELRRRQVCNNNNNNNGYAGRPNYDTASYSKGSGKSSSVTKLAKKLDVFPKTERDYTIRTERGGQLSAIGYAIMIILILAEYNTWKSMNGDHNEHIVVDTSLGKRMRVNLNISFPAIHCDDIHLDVMDVAGDSHIGLDTSMIKRRLDINTGLPMNRNTIEVRANGNALQDKQRQDVLKTELPPDYCGPCYGAKPLTENGCCDTCEDVLEAYRKMRWNDEAVQPLAEQCIREGKGNTEPTKMKGGEGCNLSGHFTVNRVGGNFHIAMGAGVDRGGSHVHNFLPEDRINFNTSHVVHDLRFLDAQYTTVSGGGEGGSSVDELSSKTGVNGERSMNGVSKFVTEETGTTGLFQYFIKVVPTRYKGEIIHDLVGGSNLEKTKHVGDEEHILETNRYFYTERFRPLIGEVHEEALLDGDAEYGTAGVHVGGRHSGGTLQERMSHHETTNAVLPGIFFVYEIYPFAVEVTRNRVPFMHLLTRIMATVGGVFTIMSLIDGALYAREKKKIGGGSRR